MTVESAIFDALTGLVSGRAYPDVAPAGVSRPYIVYQQIGGESAQYLDSTLPSRKNGRFQIAVWGDSRTSVAALALLAEQAIATSAAFQAAPIGAPVGDYESDTKLYGARQDFSIWSAR